MVISGFISQNVEGAKWKELIAVIYGTGLALVFDEFGMWLRLKDNYLLRQSYDAMLIILSMLISIVYFSSFWLKILTLPQKLKIGLFRKK